MSQRFQDLELTLGFSFKNIALLRQALTHRSYGQPHNERLEFLGDGILNVGVARLLFDAFPKCSEGELSRLRSSLVKKETLAEIALKLRLGEFIRLGEGELKSGGEQRPSILADAVEAILAAVCLDSDFAQAQALVARLFGARIGQLNPQTFGKDPKTQLQEVLQARKLAVPQYVISVQRGEGHEQYLEVQCRIDAMGIVTQGEGGSRRVAEQLAAARALAQLQQVK